MDWLHDAPRIALYLPLIGPEDGDENLPEKSVSNQLALKMWSVVARFLHEGAGILLLQKTWDNRNSEVILFPSYSGQDPAALKPDVWTAWRHVLKPALGGHTYIRDCARMVDAVPIQSEAALAVIDSEHALNLPEAIRRYRSESSGLVALILRVRRLSRSYKFHDVMNKEGDGEFVPLPFDVDLDGAMPVLSDDEFERRRKWILTSLGRG
jgi:hypothetical protein